MVYPYEICYEIISYSDYSDPLRYAFTQLLTHLWIDCHGFQEIVLPNTIRLWSQIGQKDVFEHINNIERF